jgi:hypothetical protein
MNIKLVNSEGRSANSARWSVRALIETSANDAIVAAHVAVRFR